LYIRAWRAIALRIKPKNIVQTMEKAQPQESALVL